MQAVVLTTMGKKNYWIIGLVEVMWKVVAAILNRRLTSSITFHDFFHGLRAGRGTGTSTLKSKMLLKFAALRDEVLCVIFLDLHKEYVALDRSRCLEILEGYGVGPRSQRLLQSYWRRLTIVARSGGYYWKDFKGGRGVTKGDPMSSTIFNVVVDAVVHHWVTGVVVDAKAQGGLGQEGRHQAALFYTDDGMVASSDPRWLQGAFNTLVGLFSRVVLRTNVRKTVGMVCHPCQAEGNLSTEAYGRRVKGVGPTYRERLKGPVEVGKCGELLAAGSLSSHLLTQHDRAVVKRRQWSTPSPETIPQTYRMSFLAKKGPRKFPMAG